MGSENLFCDTARGCRVGNIKFLKNIFRGIHGIAVETYIRLIDEGSCFITLGSRAVILLDYWVIV